MFFYAPLAQRQSVTLLMRGLAGQHRQGAPDALLAQLGERLLYKQDVIGPNPVQSTNSD